MAKKTGCSVDRPSLCEPALPAEKPSVGPWGCNPTVDQTVGGQNTNNLAERERSGDHKAEILSNAFCRVWSAIRRLADCLRPGSVAREILREYCTPPSRTKVPRESRLWLYGLQLGPLRGNHAHRNGNERTHVGMRDMQDTALFHPRATLLERRLFVRGWQKGAEWTRGETHSLHSDTLHTDRLASHGSFGRGGDFMLRPSNSATESCQLKRPNCRLGLDRNVGCN